MTIVGGKERYGIISDEVSPDVEAAAAWALEHGLGAVEIRSLWGVNAVDLTGEQIGRVQAILDRFGLVAAGIASPVFKCALNPDRPPAGTGDRFGATEAPVTAHYEWLKRALDLAATLKAPHVRIFSFWREADPAQHRDEILDHLRQAGELAAGVGIPLLLENEPACNGGSYPEVADLVAGVGSPGLGVLWDPGNDAYAGWTLEAAPGPSLPCHVHLKDVGVGPDGSRQIVPLGQGHVPWAAILAALDAQGYTGRFVLEPHVSGPDAIAESVRGLWRLVP